MRHSLSPITWIGLTATAAIMLVLGFAATDEESRQAQTREVRRAHAIAQGTDLYALYCAECHGSRGQGDIQKDAKELASDYARAREFDWYYNVIARGREDTDMAGFHLDEDGALNRQQVESLVYAIKYGSWDAIGARVEVLGMVSDEERALANPTPEPVLPPDAGLPVILVVPTLTPTPAGPSPEELSRAVYLQHCGACHGGQGEGTGDGPALTTATVRQMSRSELARLSFDNPDIEGHEEFLSPGDKQAILNHLQSFATSEAAQQDAQDRAIYLEYCGACHGGEGEGTDDGSPLTSDAVRQMSRSQRARISFDNPDIEGHEEFLSPDEKQAILRWLEILAGGG